MATALVRGRPATLTGVAVAAGATVTFCVVCTSELVLGTVGLTTAFLSKRRKTKYADLLEDEDEEDTEELEEDFDEETDEE